MSRIETRIAGPIHMPGRNQRVSRITEVLPRFSIITHEQEQHDDRAGVDHDLQRRREWRAQDEEDHRHGKQGYDQVDQRMGGVLARDHEQRGDERHQRRNPEEGEVQGQGNRLRTSVGFASRCASPLSLPWMVLPATCQKL